MRTAIMKPIAIIASLTLAGGLAGAQTLVPLQNGDADIGAVIQYAGSPPVGVGDKLKIAFYETIDVETTPQSGGDRQAPLRTFYQRMDLSGDYTVEQDGAISIPLLGRFRVEGQTLEDIRAELGSTFITVTSHSADIDVKIAERLPVYVVGPVKNPGAYKYVPGMIVLQAVALAGGIDRGAGSLSTMIEGVRQIERMQTAALDVNRLLAKRARLRAEHDNAATVPTPVQLTSSEDGQAARTFVVTETAIFRAERARRQQEIREGEVKAAAARKEVEALRQKLEQIDIQKAMRLERLNNMQDLKNRGLQTNNTIIGLRTELSDIEGRRQDFLVAVVQAEARLAAAEEADARLGLEHSVSLAKAIATVDQEIATAKEALDSARMLAAVLYKPTGGNESYQIVRRTKDGPKTLNVAETAPMMPGDVLKIDVGSPEFAPAFVAPAPQQSPVGSYLKAATR